MTRQTADACAGRSGDTRPRRQARQPGSVFSRFEHQVVGDVEGAVSGIGAAALAIFLIYMVVIGGRAYRRGETGDLIEYEAGTPRLVAG